jgi:hypothetical protein
LEVDLFVSCTICSPDADALRGGAARLEIDNTSGFPVQHIPGRPYGFSVLAAAFLTKTGAYIINVGISPSAWYPT